MPYQARSRLDCDGPEGAGPLWAKLKAGWADLVTGQAVKNKPVLGYTDYPCTFFLLCNCLCIFWYLVLIITHTICILFKGTLSVEAIYQDRDQFAQLVREVASPDVGRMGIEILSFTIKDVYDSVEYLESLGRAQTANVKRDADIGVAEANRDAGIRVKTRFITFTVIFIFSENFEIPTFVCVFIIF